MKKLILIIAIIVSTQFQSSAQYIFFQQDVRALNTKAVPTTLLLWDQPVKGGLSMGPFALTTYGWNEAYWYVNYTHKTVSGGLGVGMEQLEGWSFRVSPWVKLAPTLKDSTKSIQMFSLWEIGKGNDNYWYNSSITYESQRLSLGIMGRRFYGVGPIAGFKVNVAKMVINLSGSFAYDYEEKIMKPIVFLIITN